MMNPPRKTRTAAAALRINRKYQQRAGWKTKDSTAWEVLFKESERGCGESPAAAYPQRKAALMESGCLRFNFTRCGWALATAALRFLR